ncbi:MAG: hypothetical protein ACYTDE_08305 [Planctomycetota bacterium]|jgi:hypothetical protein
MRDGNLEKIATIAWREFRHTALTKSFLFGAVILPVLMGAGFFWRVNPSPSQEPWRWSTRPGGSRRPSTP